MILKFNSLYLQCDDTQKFKNIKWLKLSKGYLPVSSHFIRQEPFLFMDSIMKEIKLTQDKVVLVDDEDYEYLNQFKWCAHKHGDIFYAVRSIRGKGGECTHVRIHNVIMGTLKGMQVDHIDGDGLNCQKHNMRNCTRSENLCNRGKQKNNTSGYKGVCYYSKIYKGNIHSSWMAYIRFNGTQKHIGLFKTKEDAALAYNKKAKDIHGEFARLNVLPDGFIRE